MESYPWTLSSSFGFLELWKRENCWRMSGRGSQPVAVSCLDLFSFLWHSSWAHWMSSVASCLVGLHTFKCCDLYYLEELPVHLIIKTGLCSDGLAVVVVKWSHCHFNAL